MAKIKITRFDDYSPYFNNLQPDTEHEVLYIKHLYPWVQAIGVEVPVYSDEYRWVDQNILNNINRLKLGFVGGDRTHSSSDCEKCAFKKYCNGHFVLPCTSNQRNDGLNGHFINL